MSNFSKDQPSIRVFAPPGGRSANIFGVPEPEPIVSNKKNRMESDIFGCKKDNNETAPVKQTRNLVNNIFGNEPEQPVQKSTVYAEKNRSTIFDEAPPQQPSIRPDRQRSNIFGTDEPAQSIPTRPISEKYKSNIFGTADDDGQTKRQQSGRQGLRVGYNPINGEPYSTKDGLNSKVEQSEPTENNKETNETVQISEEQNGHSKEEANGQSNGHNATKNGHTNVRVHQPPGGRSNGPLW